MAPTSTIWPLVSSEVDVTAETVTSAEVVILDAAVAGS
jgi:hypothetical protein